MTTIIHAKLYTPEGIRRIGIKPDLDLESLKTLISKTEEISLMQYLDDENDWVTFSTEMEWKQAILMVMTSKEETKTMRLKIFYKKNEEEKKDNDSQPKEQASNEQQQQHQQSFGNMFGDLNFGDFNLEEFLQNLNDPEYVNEKMGDLKEIFKGFKGYVDMMGGWEQFLVFLKNQFEMFKGFNNCCQQQQQQQPNMNFGHPFMQPQQQQQQQQVGGGGFHGWGGPHAWGFRGGRGGGRFRGGGGRSGFGGRGRGRGGCRGGGSCGSNCGNEWSKWWKAFLCGGNKEEGGNEQQQQQQPFEMPWMNYFRMMNGGGCSGCPQQQQQQQTKEQQQMMKEKEEKEEKEKKEREEHAQKNFEKELTKLEQMGFNEKEKNLELLMKYSGDVCSVIHELLLQKQN